MRRIGQYPLLIFIGLVLLGLISRVGPLGSGLFNLEFDYSTIFSPFSKTDHQEFLDKVAVIYLDEQSHQVLNQPDTQSWDRQLHAKLLNKLTEAGTELIYFDILFQEEGENKAANEALAEAIKNNGSVVLIGLGRAAGYPTAPPQTRTSAIDASGSSV
jgi:CHASE2 domain-containing sensor protein